MEPREAVMQEAKKNKSAGFNSQREASHCLKQAIRS